MTEITHRIIEANGIAIHLAEAGGEIGVERADRVARKPALTLADGY